MDCFSKIVFILYMFFWTCSFATDRGWVNIDWADVPEEGIIYQTSTRIILSSADESLVNSLESHKFSEITIEKMRPLDFSAENLSIFKKIYSLLSHRSYLEIQNSKVCMSDEDYTKDFVYNSHSHLQNILFKLTKKDHFDFFQHAVYPNYQNDFFCFYTNPPRTEEEFMKFQSFLLVALNPHVISRVGIYIGLLCSTETYYRRFYYPPPFYQTMKSIYLTNVKNFFYRAGFQGVLCSENGYAEWICEKK